MIVDAGAQTLLARAIALADAGERDGFWRPYWAICVTRLILAALLVTLGFCYALATPDEFSRHYIFAVLPLLLICSFIPSGMLDGLQRSGLAGLANIPVFLLPAFVLLVAPLTVDGEAGTVLGLSTSLGYAIALACQFAILVWLGYRPHWVRPEREDVLRTARDSAAMLLAALPGQALFRLQILLCNLLLGTTATALFLYARQITAAFSQILHFLRRTEFPSLVQHLEDADASLPTLFKLQKRGTSVALCTSVFLLIAGMLVGTSFQPIITDAGHVLALFSAGVLTGAVYMAMSQGAFALGRPHHAAVAANLGLLAGLAVSVAVSPMIGLAGFAVGEVAAHLVGGAYLVQRLEVGHRRARVAGRGAS